MIFLLACAGPSLTDGPLDDSVGDTQLSLDGPQWPGDDWLTAEPEDRGMDSEKLDELREYVFDEGRNTQSFLVIQDGVLIAEWYAEGTDADTPVTSWSAAKSVTSALVGVGLREGKLQLDDPAGQYLSEWSEGPNTAITIRHLLEMRSGLPENLGNSYGVYFAEPDQLAYSLDREPVREPGLSFSYVNEDSMVLGGVLAQAFDQPVAELAQQEIFSVIGMEAVWWTDGEGNALTYCCIDSTARNMARFGLLYERDGKWRDTEVVPLDFLTESTTGISYGGYYGMHWWTWGGGFTAMGLHGQNIYVWPDEDLVAVRFGTYDRVGSGTERTGNNGHQTVPPETWDDSVVVGLLLEAIL